MWDLPPYFVGNNMWNVDGNGVTQTLYACSYKDWYTVADTGADGVAGVVRTYPNSHRDFAGHPAISSLRSVDATFAAQGPDTGIWEDAFDVWLNGNSTEIMVWTRNHGQTPAGAVQGTVTFDGRAYQVWKKMNGGSAYVAFVARQPVASGRLDLLPMFRWVAGQGWMPARSTLDQVCFGVEVVSTGGVPAKFSFADFSVNAS